MKEIKIFFCVFLFLCFYRNLNAQNYQVEGIIVDAKNKDLLAFVSIQVKGQGERTSSNIDGNFKINVPHKNDTLLFSYVGYEAFSLTLDENNFGKPLTIRLKRTQYFLKEVEIKAGENPANRIIRKVTANRDLNDPEQINSFRYKSYNKDVFTAIMPRQDSLIADSVFKRMSKPSRNKYLSIRRMNKFLDKQELFIIESVAQRSFLKPDFSKETVLASKVSGLKDIPLALLPGDFMSFSFYKDFITVSEKRYLNPISKGSTSKYLFQLEDTTYSGKDTVYHISFRPLKGKNFDGLKGILYINTNGYAIQNVIAEPTDNNGIGAKIQQQYEFIDNKHWFPVQLNTDITYLYSDFNMKGINMLIVGKSYLKDIEFDVPAKKNEFDNIAIEYAPTATQQTEKFWEQNRAEPLTIKNRKTYHFLDSLGQKWHLDKKIKLYAGIYSGAWPIGFVDVDITKLLDYTAYEGFRLGAGVHSNDKISRLFYAGGYGNYGSKDKKLNYGADGGFKIYQKKDVNLNIAYFNDVKESGGVEFFDDRNPSSTEVYRKLYINRMDKVEGNSVSISFLALQSIHGKISLSQYTQTATNEYFYENDPVNSHYHFAEAGIAIRYAFREKFTELIGQKISMGTKYPIMWAQIYKGFDRFLDGQFNYNRVNAKIEYSFYIKGLGKPSIQFATGFIDGNMPYSHLFNGKASGGTIKDLSLLTDNSFATMGFNEFVSDRYVYFFFAHNFGKLLYKSQRFRPELALVNNIGWGTLQNAAFHHNISIATMRKGYFETGIVVNNIFKLAGFFGIGTGIFYRYGPYAFADYRDNFAMKICVTFIY